MGSSSFAARKEPTLRTEKRSPTHAVYMKTPTEKKNVPSPSSAAIGRAMRVKITPGNTITACVPFATIATQDPRKITVTRQARWITLSFGTGITPLMFGQLKPVWVWRSRDNQMTQLMTPVAQFLMLDGRSKIQLTEH
jgi:hypothetical protein